jgi:hypothetical protein
VDQINSSNNRRRSNSKQALRKMVVKPIIACNGQNITEASVK